MKTLDVALTAVCGALYASVGYLTYLGIFCPVIGVVRFWPSVIVPAIFAVTFRPMIGALGASIGIFISDLMIHGNPLLSLTVGVPANFTCFYLIGTLSRKEVSWSKVIAISSMITAIMSITVYSSYLSQSIPFEAALILISTIIFSFALLLIIGFLRRKWRSFEVASYVGLLIGSLIIGFGVWLFSQFFMLPEVVGGGFKLPLYTSLIWFTWTFITEIPFLVIVCPPILEVTLRVFKWYG